RVLLPPRSPLFPYTTLFRSIIAKRRAALVGLHDMFREIRARKFYWALVQGDWVNDRQHIRFPLLRWLTESGERRVKVDPAGKPRSEEHTSELQSRENLVCRL